MDTVDEFDFLSGVPETHDSIELEKAKKLVEDIRKNKKEGESFTLEETTIIVRYQRLLRSTTVKLIPDKKVKAPKEEKAPKVLKPKKLTKKAFAELTNKFNIEGEFTEQEKVSFIAAVEEKYPGCTANFTNFKFEEI